MVKMGGGLVFGFVTTSMYWRLLSFDSASFKMSEEIAAVFDPMSSTTGDRPLVLTAGGLHLCGLAGCAYK